jgi:hypothetical protein
MFFMFSSTNKGLPLLGPLPILDTIVSLPLSSISKSLSYGTTYTYRIYLIFLENTGGGGDCAEHLGDLNFRIKENVAATCK